MFKLVALAINLAVTPAAPIGEYTFSHPFSSMEACEQFAAVNKEGIEMEIKRLVTEQGFGRVEVMASCQPLEG